MHYQNEAVMKALVVSYIVAILVVTVGGTTGKTDDAVITVEVEKERKGYTCTKEPGDEYYLCPFGNIYLPPPTEFPLLTVEVKPSPPDDFVVSINGTPYRTGAKMFRVKIGKCSIIVTRPGKTPCEATVEATVIGPNKVICQM